MRMFIVLDLLLCGSVFIEAAHTHIGNNIWMYDGIDNGLELQSPQCSVYQSDYQPMEFGDEKTWKCPYCHHYWPVGTACQNESCPSRY